MTAAAADFLSVGQLQSTHTAVVTEHLSCRQINTLCCLNILRPYYVTDAILEFQKNHRRLSMKTERFKAYLT